MKTAIKIFVLSFCALALLVLPSISIKTNSSLANMPVAQANDVPSGKLGVPTNAYDDSLPQGELVPLIIQITNWVLSLVGLAAFIVLIYGGILILTAAGNEDNFKKGKSAITFAVIGLIIIALSYAIVRWVMRVPFDAPPSSSADSGGGGGSGSPYNFQIVRIIKDNKPVAPGQVVHLALEIKPPVENLSKVSWDRNILEDSNDNMIGYDDNDNELPGQNSQVASISYQASIKTEFDGQVTVNWGGANGITRTKPFSVTVDPSLSNSDTGADNSVDAGKDNQGFSAAGTTVFVDTSRPQQNYVISGSKPLTVAFSTRVTDSSKIKEYVWDKNDDVYGSGDISRGPSQTSFQATYSQPGLYHPSLTVRGQDNVEYKQQFAITVAN